MQVQTEALQRALKLLDAAGCKFAILTAGGEKLGTLELAEPKPERTRRAPRYPRGTLKAYYEPLVATIQPGACAVVPYGPFDTDADSKSALRAALCSHCSDTWGNGSYISHMNDAGIELLRVE